MTQPFIRIPGLSQLNNPSVGGKFIQNSLSHSSSSSTPPSDWIDQYIVEPHMKSSRGVVGSFFGGENPSSHEGRVTHQHFCHLAAAIQIQNFHISMNVKGAENSCSSRWAGETDLI